MKTVLITGSTGFIGKHISQRLKQNMIKVIDFCLKDHQDVSKIKDFDDLPAVDIVFHLAAVSGYRNSKEDVNSAYRVNVSGTANVLEYCRRVGAKCVFASTYVYDQPYEE